MVHDFSNKNSVIQRFIGELRDVNIQKDPLRFRRNLERIGEIFAYEVSHTLEYEIHEVETPLGVANVNYIADRIVLSTILRAGLPMHQGMLNYFDRAENAFVSAYRMHHKDGTFEIKVEYISCPSLEHSVLIIVDPMLATGASMEIAINALKKYGKPKQIHIVAAIASAEGLNHIQRRFPDAEIWIGAVDEELTARSYIVPGLGDAGDLSYGKKIQN